MADMQDMSQKPWEKEGWVTMVDEHHEIKGCTPEQLDWWWDNMEKGYPLWHPEDHKSFVWEAPPTPGTAVGAIQINEQGPPGVAKKPEDGGEWMDPDSLPQDIKDWIIYEHFIALGQMFL